MNQDHGFESGLAIERAARELIRHYGPADAARIARERAETGSGGAADVWRDVADAIEGITSNHQMP
jgi:RecJ-like exonuclease